MELKRISLSTYGIDLYESKHQDGDRVEPHYHHVHQLLYVIEGEGLLTLGQHQQPFLRNEAAWIVPHTRHAVISDSTLTLLVLAFDHQALDASVRDQLLCSEMPESTHLQLGPIPSGDVRQLLRGMLFEQTRQDSLVEWAMKAKLLALFLVLARAKRDLQLDNAHSLQLERLRSYLDSHYYEALSASQIAARMGFSVRHVNNIFKEKYKVTPMQYLSEVRVSVARKMLVSTSKDIASICFEVGFENLSSFYRTFKQQVGISPHQFRKSHFMTT